MYYFYCPMKYCFYILTVLLITSCNQEVIREEHATLSVSCDAEKIEGENFISGESEFKGSKFRSSEKSRSGKYSVKLNEATPYGFTYTIPNVKKGDIIEASVWKHLDGATGGLVISSEDPDFQQYDFNFSYRKTEGEWGQVKSFFVAQHDYDKVLIYAHNAEKSV